MKKIILAFLGCIACLSCRLQEKKDIEKLDFSENYKDILKDAKFQTDQREIITTLPVAYTKNVNLYKFGNIYFQNSNEKSLKSSTVGILINNITERQTKGIKIEIEETSISNNMLTYLKSKYKSPKIIAGIPKKNKEGEILGNAAYQWDLEDRIIVLVQYYEYTNGKPNISSVLYVVDNKVRCIGLQETVSSHIIKTYTP